ncbi:MAG: hypothetical protein SF051_05440 [Elusimicrobiota bacterium]|nr:hypothetical protein [Elusimicrobiota bacterium]
MNKALLLANVAKSYREAMRRNKAGKELASLLGLHDGQILERFRVGYADGSLLKALPTKGAVRDALVESGIITPEGKEAAAGCLMVPVLDPQENVLGFVAAAPGGDERRLPADLAVIHLNWQAFKERSVIFTDSVLKALLYAQAGQSNATPVGPQISHQEKAIIERSKPDKVYLAAALPDVTRLLQQMEVPCYQIETRLPAKPDEVARTFKAAEPVAAAVGPDAVVRVTDDALRFECGGRKYEVRELAPGEADRLRVRIRVQGENIFHLDTLDLYAGRSRISFARAAAPVHGVSESAVEGDLRVMIGKLEAIRAARKTQAGSASKAYVMTPDEEAEALEFLRSPDLLDRAVRDLDALGYVGEEANKRLGYLITVSRKLDSPLCGVIISRAAAGKSRLMETLAEIVPPEDVMWYTRITPQALYYAGERDLKHKLVVSGEAEGLLGSDYVLRELISSKKLRLGTPVRDTASGRMKTVEYEVEGPIALLFSTTQPAIHYENATRCFILSLDETEAQTARVHHAQRLGRTVEGFLRSSRTRDLRQLHRNAQRLLRPITVVNPFAPQLAFPTDRLESRREHEKYLSLIEAVAFLRQHRKEIKKFPVDGREREYVEVEPDDIAEANKLFTELFGTSQDELARPSRELLRLIREMVTRQCQRLEIDATAYRFNRRDIREHTGWSDNQIKAHIKQLEELQYLLVKQGERGKLYRYELAYDEASEGKRFFGLTDSKKLEKLGLVGSQLGNGPQPNSADKTGDKGVSSGEVGHSEERRKPAQKTEQRV